MGNNGRNKRPGVGWLNDTDCYLEVDWDDYFINENGKRTKRTVYEAYYPASKSDEERGEGKAIADVPELCSLLTFAYSTLLLEGKIRLRTRHTWGLLRDPCHREEQRGRGD